MVKYICTIVFLLSVLNTYAQQFEIELNGEVDFSNLEVSTTEAGLNFSSSLESTADVLLTIRDSDSLGKKSNPNNKWTLWIRKEDRLAEDINILVMRTGKGNRIGSNGSPNIHGGIVYQELGSTSNYFCHGKGEIADISLRFKLDGISVLSGAGNHQVDVVFSVNEGWK